MRLKLAPLLFVLIASPVAQAGDFRLGTGLGYGGAGITKVDSVGTDKQSVKRSEGPGTFSLFLDYMVSDSIAVGFEHARGYRLGPFSSGVGFTGITTRWYFRTPAPTVARAAPDQSTLLVKQFSFFVGLGSGIAAGTINRDEDLVPSVTSSGVYIGFILGADYPLSPGVVLRPQITSYSTFSSSSKTSPAELSYFSFGAGIYFFL
jgi:hypothetical protein